MSQCDCLSSEWEHEQAAELMNKVVKARKTHNCPACGDTIDPGTEYRLMKYAAEGAIDTYKYHECCIGLINAVASHYMTGWFWNCSLRGCVDGWAAEIRDPRIIELVDAVFTHMDRADAKHGEGES